MARSFRPFGSLAVLGSLVAVLVLAAAPAAADWLVLRDGTKLETKGPWTVRGTMVVFTQPNGTLAMLKASEVDLDQSAVATTQAKTGEPAQAGATPKTGVREPTRQKPVLVLRDRDVAHVNEAGETTEKTDAKGAEAKPEPGLSVQGWQQTPTGDGTGTEVFGALKNETRNTATNITVVVKVYDDSGAMLGTAEAVVSSTALAPGQSTNFRAAFPGIVSFKDARFEVNSRGFVTAPATPDEKKPSA